MSSCLWQTVTQVDSESSEIQGVQDYLWTFSDVLGGGDYITRDKVEWLVLMVGSTGPRQRKELVYHHLARRDQERFCCAMRQEMVTNILRPDAAELLSLKESLDIQKNPQTRSRVIPTRWVLVEKDMGKGESTQAKARLVLQGYKDPDLGEMEVSSPTLHRDSLSILLQMIASYRWRLRIIDIKGAFMSSRPLQREQGDVYASLPRLWLHPDLADSRQLIRVKVAWYGLNDGPREFYTTLDNALRSLGCVRNPLDPCVYVWYSRGKPAGILGITVNDICTGGSEEFVQSVLEPLGKRFTFGKVCIGSGRFTGRDLRQEKDFSIVLDQRGYIEEIEPANIPRERRMLREAPLSDAERSLLRAKAGELNWIQAVSRPDLSGAISLLQTSFGEPRIFHLLEANKLIKEAKQHPVEIKFQAIKPEQLMFVCSADAAWANCPDLASHMGYIILAADKSIDLGLKVPISLVGWKAHKQRRKASSTLSAETMATSEGIGALDWFRVFWEWATTPDFVLKDWEKRIAARPALALTDCKSVYDSLQQLWSSASKTDRRTSIDLAIVREALSRDLSKIRWIDTSAQLADSLTKSSASGHFLRSVLRSGSYQVVAEGTALERRNAQKKERGSSGY